MGINIYKNPFINSLSICLDIPYNTIVKKIIKSIVSDSEDKLFSYILEGKIKNYYKNRISFLNYLKNNINLIEINLLIDIVIHPRVILQRDLIFFFI